MEPRELKNVLEALLFVSNRPLKAKEAAGILELPEEQVKQALDELAKERKNSGIVVLNDHSGYQLSTNSHYSTQVKNFLNAELREKLTDATVEVLAIIAYRQPISKAEIEAIRGVNSQYSLRNLLIRGLIEKVPNPLDARSHLYQTTTEFLMHLGLNSNADLPDFAQLTAGIKLPQTPALQNEPVPENNPQPQALTQALPASLSQSEPNLAQNQDGPAENGEAEEEFDDEEEDEEDEDE